MKIMSEAEIAWVAGLFEGEGCISTRGVQHGCKWYLRIGMTDNDVVDRVHRLTGVGNLVIRNRPDNPGHWQAQTLWTVYRAADLRDFLTLIRPWLGKRRGARVDECLTTLTVPA